MGRMISDEERQAYAEDGAICLRGAVPRDLCAEMLDAALALIRHHDSAGAEGRYEESKRAGKGRYFHANSMWQSNAVFRRFAFDSPLPGLARQLLQAEQLRFFYDQLLYFEAGTEHATAWHNDLTYWPFEGNDIVSLWVALTPVTADTAPVEYLAGSHLAGQLYQAASTDAGAADADAVPVAPDYNLPANRGGDKRFLSWELDPGDILVHHPLVLHGSRTNRSKDKARCGLSLRYLGDDVRYHPRSYSPVKRVYPVAVGAYPADDEALPLIAA